jgi:hypothetical protein
MQVVVHVQLGTGMGKKAMMESLILKEFVA